LYCYVCIENYGKPCDKLWKLFAKNMCTQIQKKKAISNEFWNRMNWIKSRTMAGFSSQKCSSEGFTCASSTGTGISATLWPKLVIMCSNLAPTSSRSCHSNQLDVIRLASNFIHQNMSTKPFKSVFTHTYAHTYALAQLYLQLLVKRTAKKMYATLHFHSRMGKD